MKLKTRAERLVVSLKKLFELAENMEIREVFLYNEFVEYWGRNEKTNQKDIGFLLNTILNNFSVKEVKYNAELNIINILF